MVIKTESIHQAGIEIMRYILFLSILFRMQFLQAQTLYNFIGPENTVLEINSDCSNIRTNCLIENYGLTFYHPEGFFCRVKFKQPVGGINNVNIYFYKLDKNLCDESLYYSYLTKDYSIINFVYMDYLGRFYTVATIGNKFPYSRAIIRFDHLGDTFTIVKKLKNTESIRDMFLYKNYWYINYADNPTFIQLDTSFNEIKRFDIPKFLSYWTVVANSCDSVSVYASGLDTDFYDGYNTMNNDTMYLVQYDIENNKVIQACNIPTGLHPGHLFSTTEFLASDPECDLLIDLDKNNSCGLLPYNFQLDRNFCEDSVATLLCDEDLYIHTSFTLDSLTFCVSPWSFNSLEYLTSKSLPVGFNFIRTNDSCWLLTKPFGSDNDYRIAMSSIQYINLDLTRISQRKDIQIQGFNSIKKGTIVHCYLNVGSHVSAGVDSIVTICEKENIIPMKSLLDSKAGQNGDWQFPNSNLNGLFDPLIDSTVLYSYIINDKYCGSDTANFKLSAANIPPLNILFIPEICKGDSIYLEISNFSSYDHILVNQNTSNSKFLVTEPDTFYFEAFTSENCKVFDTIQIHKSTNLFQKDLSIQLCENKSYSYNNLTYSAGSVIFDTLSASMGCDTALRIQLIQVSNPRTFDSIFICPNSKFNFKNRDYSIGKSFLDTISSLNSCDTIRQSFIHAFDVDSINLSGSLIVCKDQSTTLTTEKYKNYFWSNGDTSSYSTFKAGSYSLLVKDKHDCNISNDFTISESNDILFDINKSDPSCDEPFGNIVLTNMHGGIEPYTYFLNNNKFSTPIFSQLSSGLWIIKLIDSLGCVTLDSVIINPVHDFDVSIDPEQLELDLYSDGISHYRINVGNLKVIEVEPNEDIQFLQDQIIIHASKDREYHFRFIDIWGCVIEKIIRVTIRIETDVFIPNVFSPNANEVNDTWAPLLGSSLDLISLSIFDRWGERIFFTNNSNESWDGTSKGKPVVPGVYIYLINYKDPNGKSIQLSGDLTLLR
ncbi:MAG: gliding motility-associated C-terminal domain-containing protein [Saprospiraceae bacterium]